MAKLEFCRRLVHLDRKPISFQERPYLPAVYDCRQGNLVLRCSRQTEKSSFLANTILYETCTSPGIRVLLVCPRYEARRWDRLGRRGSLADGPGDRLYGPSRYRLPTAQLATAESTLDEKRSSLPRRPRLADYVARYPGFWAPWRPCPWRGRRPEAWSCSLASPLAVPSSSVENTETNDAPSHGRWPKYSSVIPLRTAGSWSRRRVTPGNGHSIALYPALDTPARTWFYHLEHREYDEAIEKSTEALRSQQSFSMLPPPRPTATTIPDAPST